MALTVVTSGTTTPVVGAESVLSTQTPGSPTTYVFRIDGGALLAGEVLNVKIYTKTLTAGTERSEVNDQIVGVADPAAYVSIPVPTDISFKVGITQMNGTARAFPWKLFSL